MLYGHRTVANPECARGGGVSHILGEKRVLASLLSQKSMKMQFLPISPMGTLYAGSATLDFRRHNL